MRSWFLPVWLLLAMCCAPLQRPALETAGSVSPTSGRDALPPLPGRIDRGCPSSAEEAAASAIRSPDALLGSLLIEGCRQSPTLQRLADAIGRTDGVVYLTIGDCPLRTLRGCLLHVIQDTGNARYLWIRLTANADSRELVGTMAHELQHALEALARNHIRSLRDLLDFYHSFQSQAYGGTTFGGPYRTYETSAAINVAAAVRAELAAVLGAVSADDRE